MIGMPGSFLNHPSLLVLTLPTDHVLGRPSSQFRKVQVFAVVSFWSLYLLRYAHQTCRWKLTDPAPEVTNMALRSFETSLNACRNEQPYGSRLSLLSSTCTFAVTWPKSSTLSRPSPLRIYTIAHTSEQHGLRRRWMRGFGLP